MESFEDSNKCKNGCGREAVSDSGLCQECLETEDEQSGGRESNSEEGY